MERVEGFRETLIILDMIYGYDIIELDTEFNCPTLPTWFFVSFIE